MIYSLMKRIIERGGYDKTDVMTKLDVYLAFGRITRDEYAELTAAVSAE